MCSWSCAKGWGLRQERMRFLNLWQCVSRNRVEPLPVNTGVPDVPTSLERSSGNSAIGRRRGFRRKLRIWALKGVDLWSIVFANECYSTR